MKNRPFLIFVVIIGTLVAAIAGFVQSSRFATVVKRIAVRYLPADIGIDGDFSDFSVTLFPPGISINHPKVSVRSHNILNLPTGSRVSAERIDLKFRAFQMFSGNIRVHEVVIENGEVHLVLSEDKDVRKSKKLKLDFHWDELLQIRAEALVIQNTKLHLETPDSSFALDFLAKNMRLGQWSGKGGLGYELAVSLSDISGKFGRDWYLPNSLDQVSAAAHVNALGAQIDQLAVSGQGVEATASGSIRGNVLAPTSLAFEMNATAKGELNRFFALVKKGSAPNLTADGSIEFSGKVRGNLEKLAETLKAEGTLRVRNAKFQKWYADLVQADAKWESSKDGGEVAVTKALVMAKEVEREGSSQPGSGGKVELGAFRFSPRFNEPITVPIALDRVHVQWFAGPAIKDLYPLTLRASGNVQAVFTPPSSARKKDWSLASKLALTVQELQLDNQHLGKPKKLKKILHVPKIKVDGPIAIDSHGLYLNNIAVETPKIKVRGNGKVDFKTGFDLRAGGPMDLEDVGQLVENEIRGVGQVSAHIHGPFKNLLVDFDAQLRNASYLNLKLGDIKGLLTWDDEPNHLLLKRVDGKRGPSVYSASGMVDAGKETIALGVDIPQGTIQDFLPVFDHMTADIWWMPRSLMGAMNATVTISGGLDLTLLQILANIHGTGWEYLGERFKTVSIVGGYDRGKFHISDFKGLKRSGLLLGRISFDQYARKFDWDLKTQDFSVTDFDHVATLDVPIRGRFMAKSSGSGKEGALESSTAVSVADLSVRGLGLPPSTLTLRTQAGIAKAQGTALGGQGTLEMAYNFKPNSESFIKGELKQLDFTPALLLLNSKAMQDQALGGYISGSMNLAFRSGEIDRATGTVQLSQYVLAKSDTGFQLDHPVTIKAVDGTFDLKDLVMTGRQKRAVMELQSRKGSLQGSVQGELDTSIAEFFTPVIASASGPAKLDFAIGGSIKEPVIYGKSSVNGSTLKVAAVDSPFENITGAFQLKQGVINVQNMEGDLAGGRVGASGKIELFTNKFPEINLKGNLRGTKLKVYPFLFVKASGNLLVHGQEPPYLVEGNVAVDSALSKEKIFSQRQSGSSLKTLQYTPAPSAKRESSASLFKLDIESSAERGILVENELLNVEAKGDIHIINTFEAPRVIGSAEVIQGKIFFQDRIFQVQSGSVNFDNPTVINPSFNIVGNTEVNGVKIQLFASGRLDKPKAELTSNPAMSESEIISLLTTGLTTSESKKLSASDRSAVQQGEALSLVLSSSDINRELKNKAGLELQVDETVNSQQGSSAFRPQSQSETSASPKLVIKKRVQVPGIDKDADLSVGSTMGGTNNQKDFKAEIHWTPNFSTIGVVESYDSVNTQDNKNISGSSIGVDFKWQKRIK